MGKKRTLVEVEPRCIECGDMGMLVSGDVVYPHRPDLWRRRFYLCACGAYCGCHPHTVVSLGFPAGPETRRARNVAHEVFDPLWRLGSMTRPEAYQWLAKATGIPFEQCHIAMMTADQARLVVRVVNALTWAQPAFPPAGMVPAQPKETANEPR